MMMLASRLGGAAAPGPLCVQLPTAFLGASASLSGSESQATAGTIGDSDDTLGRSTKRHRGAAENGDVHWQPEAALAGADALRPSGCGAGAGGPERAAAAALAAAPSLAWGRNMRPGGPQVGGKAIPALTEVLTTPGDDGTPPGPTGAAATPLGAVAGWQCTYNYCSEPAMPARGVGGE
jgi:hypothetical protein